MHYLYLTSSVTVTTCFYDFCSPRMGPLIATQDVKASTLAPLEPAAHQTGHRTSVAALALGALGVVFGDIGTSPLYTLRECMHAAGGTKAGVDDLYGILSLMFWALVMVVTVKYLTFVMRADHGGEGGIFALLAIVPERFRTHSAQGGKITGMALLAVIGASLLYGDGAITPAISVLSAVEGLAVASPRLSPLVLPITCTILVALFSIQRLGTGKVGKLFGPVMVIWFATMAALGLYHLVHAPQILVALSPHHGAAFFLRHGPHGLLILGSVVLAVTGGEALYADMGHFGVRPIRLTWTFFVLPALVLGYLGQGALILRHPGAVEHPFYAMVPAGLPTYLLVLLSSRGDGDCFSGIDFRGILADSPGDAARISSQSDHQAHGVSHRGADLHSGSQQFARDWLSCTGLDVP